jgi:hypothetical protein
MIKLQEFNFPADCVIINHEFYDYDPEKDYKLEDSIEYLDEDLLQVEFPEDDMVIDLGWFGDLFSNKGEFKISMIQNGNWEIPLEVLYFKSVEEVKEMLNKIFIYYTSSEESE